MKETIQKKFLIGIKIQAKKSYIVRQIELSEKLDVRALMGSFIDRREKAFSCYNLWGHAPINQMGYLNHLATSNNTDVVTPNGDTLYNIAWLELEKEPIVLHVPDTKERGYVQQFLDAYTNTFKNIDDGTTGTEEGNFVIIGPG